MGRLKRGETVPSRLALGAVGGLVSDCRKGVSSSTGEDGGINGGTAFAKVFFIEARPLPENSIDAFADVMDGPITGSKDSHESGNGGRAYRDWTGARGAKKRNEHSQPPQL